MTRRTDRSFRRFAETRDPRALARVFDKTAAELLRVARYLTADGHRAEDAVQETFLVALRKADEFEEGRQVMPWLLGILAHVAQDLRRRELRRDTADGEDLDAAAAAFGRQADLGPDATAEQTELKSALDEALDSMPEPYRRVCVLHLRNGLRPIEIADALQLNDATVRTRIRRGMELLRRTLPAGFAAGTAFWLTSGTRGLAAVRTSVLGHLEAAGVPGAATSATFFGLGTLLVKQTLSIVAVMCLAALSTWFFFADPGTAQGPTQDRTSTKVAGSRTGAVEATAPTKGEHPAVGTPAVREAVDAASRTGSAEVLVRDVTAATRVAGAGVCLWPHTGPDLLWHARTDTNGWARFEQLDVGEYGVSLGHGLTATLRVSPGELATHTFRLTGQGQRVRCRVVDPAGTAIARARIYSCANAARHRAVLVGQTGEDGQLTIFGCSADLLFARRTGWQPSIPTRLRTGSESTDPDGVTTLELTLAMGAPATRVTGVVVDETSEPVPSALVCVLPVEGAREGKTPDPDEIEFNGRDVMFVRADREGRFELDEVPATTTRFVARSPAKADARSCVQDVQISQAGAYVTLRIGDGARVSGIVLDRAGTPQAGQRVEIESADMQFRGGMERSFGHMFDNITVSTGSDGRFEARNIPSMHCQLRVFGTRIKLRHTFTPDEHLVWNPVLDGVSVSIAVRDNNDRPLDGWAIGITDATTDGRFDPLWAERRTDAAGRYLLQQAPAARLRISVHPPEADGGASWIPAVTLADVAADGREITVVVDRLPHAGLTGIVLSAAGEPVRGAVLELFPTWTHSARRDVTVAQDGRFEVRDVLSGDYRIECRAPRFARTTFGVHSIESASMLDIQTWRMSAVARLRVTVFDANGLPTIALVRLMDENDLPLAQLRLDRSGEHYALDDDDLVAPGAYRVLVQGDTTVGTSTRATLRSGENRVEVTPVATATTCRFQIELPSTGSRGSIFAQLEIRDSAGHVVWRHAMRDVSFDTADDRSTILDATLAANESYIATLHDQHFDRSTEHAFSTPTSAPTSAPIVIGF